MSEIDDLLEELTRPRGDEPEAETGPGQGDAGPPAARAPLAADPQPQRGRDAGIVAAVAVALVLLLGGGYLAARPGRSGTQAEGASTTAAVESTTTVSSVATSAVTSTTVALTSTTAPAPASTTTAPPAGPTTAPTAPTGTADPATAVRSIVVDQKQVHLRGRVASQAEVERLVAAYTQRWGEAAVVNELVIDPAAPATVTTVPVSLPVAVVFPSGSYTVGSTYRWMLGVAADLLKANPGLRLRATIYATGDERPQTAMRNAQARVDALQKVLVGSGAPAGQIVPDIRPGPAPAEITVDPDRVIQLTMEGTVPA